MDIRTAINLIENTALGDYEIAAVREYGVVNVYVTLNGKTVGFLETARYTPYQLNVEEGSEDAAVMNNRYGVSEVRLWSTQHRGKGLGLAMYRELISNLPDNCAGIYSDLSSRGNQVQVPKIWDKIGGRLTPSGKFAVIDNPHYDPQTKPEEYQSFT